MKINKLFKYLITGTILVAASSHAAEIHQKGSPKPVFPTNAPIQGIISQDSSLILLKGKEDKQIYINGSIDNDFNELGKGILIIGGTKQSPNIITGDYVNIDAVNGIDMEYGNAKIELKHVNINAKNIGIKLAIPDSEYNKLYLDNFNIKSQKIGLQLGNMDAVINDGSIIIDEKNEFGFGISSYDTNITLNRVNIESNNRGMLISSSKERGEKLTIINDSTIKAKNVGVYLTDGNNVSLKNSTVVSNIGIESTFPKNLKELRSENLKLYNSTINSNKTFYLTYKTQLNVESQSSFLISGHEKSILYDNNDTSVLNLNAISSNIEGKGILSENSKANISLNNSSWKINGDTQVTNLVNNNSNIILSGNVHEDKNFIVFHIKENMKSDNGTIIMNLHTKNAETVWDQIIVDGNVEGKTKIKIIDKTTEVHNIQKAVLVKAYGNVENEKESFVLSDYEFNGTPVVSIGSHVYTFNYEKIDNLSEWYLKPDEIKQGVKSYNAAIPLYESYTNILLKINESSTMRENKSGRQYNNNFWLKTFGNTGKFNGNLTTTETSYKLNMTKIQLGVDFDINDSFTGGLFVQYGDSSAKINSIFGNGKIKTHFYGVGANITYDKNNFYIDTQYQFLWGKSDIYSNQFNKNMTTNNKSFGYNVSLEAGKRFNFNSWTITPQFQVSYNNVKFDSFLDTTELKVNGNRHGIVNTRIGISVDKEFDNLKVNGIVNIYQDFNNKTEIKLEDSKISRKEYATRLGIGVGFDYKAEKYSVFGTAEYRPSLKDFEKNYDLRGAIGVRVNF